MEKNYKKGGLMRSKLVKSLFRANKASIPMQCGNKVSPTLYNPNGLREFRTSHSCIAPQQTAVSLSHRSFRDPGGDENVDMKAATYIAYVRERFNLERLDP
ncbi:hypothetical protein K2173_003285 [Erythroxylum novogranatense]|uniref:Uncharacterized protein n=1 Tax=Erythroxylum novogranatense TaxID=1862640 RepID=A0AAV8SXD4_9ROSI|nr:hypothetical protein K2173_003285 [Erythroxylum novogranatense]